MEYILLIHKIDSAQSRVEELADSEEQWNEFLIAARKSGVFAGGSAINPGELIGACGATRLSEKLTGHMRFNTHGAANGKEIIRELLKRHPTVVQGGTVELCEMPETP